MQCFSSDREANGVYRLVPAILILVWQESSFVVGFRKRSVKLALNKLEGEISRIKTKKPSTANRKGLKFELAPTYSPGTSDPVPSALAGLTALFGMGRGRTPPPKAPTFLGNALSVT